MTGTGAPDRPAGGASGIEISPISFSRRSGAPPEARPALDVRFLESAADLGPISLPTGVRGRTLPRLRSFRAPRLSRTCAKLTRG